MSASATPLTPVTLLRRIGDRRWTVFGAMVAVALAMIVVDLLAPKAYAATATVAVAPVTDDPFGNQQLTQLINMETERAVVTSTAVAEQAARALGSQPSPRAVQDALSVTIPQQSVVIRITATTDDPVVSAEWANAVADAYLRDRQEAATAAGKRYNARLQEAIDTRMRTRGLLTAAEKSLVDREVLALRERQHEVAAVGANPGRVVGRAMPPASDTGLSSRVIVFGGLALGLLIGVLLALAQDRIDGRIHSARRVRDDLGLPAEGARDDSLDRPARRVLALASNGGPPGQVAVLRSGDPAAPSLAEAVRRQADSPIPTVTEVPLDADGIASLPALDDRDVVVLDLMADSDRDQVSALVDRLADVGLGVDLAVVRPSARHGRLLGVAGSGRGGERP